jgi:hypothetical protein
MWGFQLFKINTSLIIIRELVINQVSINALIKYIVLLVLVDEINICFMIVYVRDKSLFLITFQLTIDIIFFNNLK